jgi:protocatechuate 3,4-dioxygenase beta subunit
VRWGNIDGVRDRDLRESFSADEFLGSRVLRTDADGRFRIDRLPEGRLLLKIEHEDFAAWYRKDLMIGASGEEPAVTAQLEATLTISGHVRGADTGRPVRGAFVYARERGPLEGQEPDPGRVQAVVSAESGEDGGYVLHHVPPGVHEIVVWIAEGYIGEAQQRRNAKVRHKGVVAGSAGVDFDLDPIVPPETVGK